MLFVFLNSNLQLSKKIQINKNKYIIDMAKIIFDFFLIVTPIYILISIARCGRIYDGFRTKKDT